MTAVIASILIGIIAGYAGQRSRFCIVSGIRDFYLFKDWYRLKGLFGLISGAFLGYLLFKILGGDIAGFPMLAINESLGYWVLSIIGGIGIGFFSILSEGCPFRQHVMVVEGRQSALYYLIGFYIGIVYFYFVTIKIMDLVVLA